MHSYVHNSWGLLRHSRGSNSAEVMGQIPNHSDFILLHLDPICSVLKHPRHSNRRESPRSLCCAVWSLSLSDWLLREIKPPRVANQQNLNQKASFQNFTKFSISWLLPLTKFCPGTSVRGAQWIDSRYRIWAPGVLRDSNLYHVAQYAHQFLWVIFGGEMPIF